ncbi:hypothetical protein PR048_028552 [Dryococelus australis]|uniref:Uncharacterized protein n=1 Tax=Dryococelus australis TaxID=614101 RepID=A0ABQ9GDF5_9NEOP|nr:hypothetical protein PR048_028552 [Dryococelus australis]
MEESDSTTSEENIGTDIEDPPILCSHSQHSASSEIESECSDSEECGEDSQPPNQPTIIWELFISQCKKTVIPKERVTIDEQLV